MKFKFSAVLFIIVFILIAAAIFTVLSSLDKDVDLFGGLTAQQTPAALPTPTVMPVTTPFAVPDNTPVPTPVVTPAANPLPAQTPAPVTAAPAPVVTPMPTTAPTTVPMQTTLGSGSFRSNTGTGLDLVADWSAQAIDANQIQVTVSVSAISYALHTQALPNAVNIALDGQYDSLEAPAINYDGGDQMITPLASRSFTVALASNSSRALSLQVEWQFNGVYGNTELPAIECGGTISVSR